MRELAAGAKRFGRTPTVHGTRCRRFIAWLSFAALTGAATAAEIAKQVEPDLAELGRLPLIQLNPPPAWSSGRPGAASLWTVDDIAAELRKITDRPPNLNYSRESFVRPDHAWLVAYTKWFVRLRKSLKLDFKNEAWDCDNYARCFVAFANVVASGGSETRGSICVGWATVYHRFAFGGVAGGGAHAVVIVGTSNGLFVIEPQTGEMAPLRAYPNRNDFEAFNL